MADVSIMYVLKAADCKCGPKFHFKKTPDEQFGVGVDFLLDLPDGVYISSAVATATDLRTKTDATATVIDGLNVEMDADGNNTFISILVIAGTLGHGYRIKLLTTLDDALPTIREHAIEFNVQPTQDL